MIDEMSGEEYDKKIYDVIMEHPIEMREKIHSSYKNEIKYGLKKGSEEEKERLMDLDERLDRLFPERIFQNHKYKFKNQKEIDDDD